MNKKHCYCVLNNGYSDCPGDTFFSIEKVFYGDNAREKAIQLAIKLNITYIKEMYESIDMNNSLVKILTNIEKSPEENLEEYIHTLDYSHGNFRYESTFYSCSSCELEIN